MKRERTLTPENPYPTPEPPWKRRKRASFKTMDLDVTPRASGTRPTIESYDIPSVTSSSPSLSSQRSKRSRTTETVSPSKRAMLLTLPRSVNIHAYNDAVVPENALLHFRKLINDVLDFAEGYGTVPDSLKAELMQHSERSFRRSDVYFGTGSDRWKLGTAPTLADVDRIVAKARELREDADSEAAWNSFVHGPLAMLAECNSSHRNSVSIKNIVHATVSPNVLNPVSSERQPIRSKMVDFAIVLRPDADLNTSLSTLEQYPDGGIRSFNHTRHGPLIDKSIAVSIETKPEGESLQDAQVQLAVWAAAHLNRLSHLKAESGAANIDLPFLPLLLAQGPQWFFLFAARCADGSTKVWTKVEFGDASTRLGVFKIISVLQLLVNWSECQFRPWFKTNAMPRSDDSHVIHGSSS